MRSHPGIAALLLLALLAASPARAQGDGAADGGGVQGWIDHATVMWNKATEVFNGDAAQPAPPTQMAPPTPPAYAPQPYNPGYAAAPGQAGFVVPQVANPMRAGLSDDQVRAAIVREQMGRYIASGRCFCPDQPDAAGRPCGTRAAYGHSADVPVCYISQVDTRMIWQWRSAHPAGR